jgi:hypothetical protein
VAIDDFSRLAYVEVLADERASTAIGFLRRALRFYAEQGVAVERVLTDNGSAYRSTAHAVACRIPRHPPPAHPPSSSTDKWEGGALHPHDARRLGLRAHLRLKPGTHSCAGWMA